MFWMQLRLHGNDSSERFGSCNHSLIPSMLAESASEQLVKFAAIGNRFKVSDCDFSHSGSAGCCKLNGAFVCNTLILVLCK